MSELDPHKNISGEQRQLQLFSPILPASNAFVQRQEAVNAISQHLLCNTLFMTRSGVGGVPARLFAGSSLEPLRRRSRSKIELVRSRHRIPVASPPHLHGLV